MPFLSVDNVKIAADVQGVKSAYVGFESGLRGVVAETLSNLNLGIQSIASMGRGLASFATTQEEALVNLISRRLSEASMSALAASQAFSSASVSDKALLAASELVDGFTSDLSDKLSKQMMRDIKSAEEFVRKQLIQGRVVATTHELGNDLEFFFSDASGRKIKSSDYAFREINWAIRTLYNTLLILASSELGVENFQVVGGSHEGEVMTIEDYEKKSGAIFHHNTKALLQPH